MGGIYPLLLCTAHCGPFPTGNECEGAMIGQHDFTSLPRSLFAMTVQPLPCTRDKSQLMAIHLKSFPATTEDGQQPNNVTTDSVPLPSKKVTLTDGMAVVQALGKNKTSIYIQSPGTLMCLSLQSMISPAQQGYLLHHQLAHGTRNWKDH